MAQLKVTAVPYAQDANIKFPAKDYPANEGTFVGKTKIAAVPATQPSGGNLQSKSKSYTPTESAVSETISPDPGYDGLSQVDVSVGAISSTYVGSGVTQRTSSDLTDSGATVTAPAGYYASSASKAVSSGSATPAATISASGAGKTVGNGSITLTKSAVSNTPQVTPGYISSGTAGNTSVSLTASVTTQAGQTIHPSTTEQSIAANTYVLGAQTIKAVQLTNLTPANILAGVTVKVGDDSDDDCVASVTGNATASSYTLKGTTTLTVSTTSTTAATAGSLECGSGTFEKSKIVYVRVRDKAGPRAGYFYGSDAWFINYQDANGSTTTLTAAGRQGVMYNSSNQWATASSSYGVYGYSITSGGKVTIRRRYNSSYGTINGDFLVQVYMLDYPDGHSPFNTGVIT